MNYFDAKENDYLSVNGKFSLKNAENKNMRLFLNG